MAVSMTTFAVVSSLQNCCLRAIALQLPLHEQSLDILPLEVKGKLFQLLSKRGLLSDANLQKVVYSLLHEIDLSESNVSDRGLEALSSCTHLRKLDLNAVKGSRESVTSAGIIKVASCCRKLQTVYLRRCVRLSDAGIVALTEYCPHLLHLNLGGCPVITDASLEAAADNCCYLQSLNVSKTKVTDSGVTCLATGKCCKSLKEVHLALCVEITDTAIEALVGGCPQISILVFHGCVHVTDRSRQAVEELSLGRKGVGQLSWTVY